MNVIIKLYTYVSHSFIFIFQENVENLSLDGFMVVYSITDRQSFDIAVEVLKQLRDEVGANKAIILVGNKTDLVRKRTISADGKY